ncbi:hypothetical protein FT663_03897 [Candidozyma haemuli var. vulneris]|uniref:Uncharacterized protein n=1 Tax=Candidozyma haemuli TaxID=45357 RepID=A0A2V1AN95_9ASCO|nr:hypothetical protein CXQ85_001635 [[Candida] haemuloni]KAF3987494.1 hypothetical protein FT662_03970 [[Candida] haemuloni var. vulneris]KAF3988792.1 hypothetical protein FT663_03897 [[Candida] haemuloni var. vulneris]PVH19328.1 hypothetical protein CXQ85_001635 [[Candida] haemuloni]
MSSVTVVPATGAANNHGYSRQAVPVKFSPPQDKSDFSPSLPFKVDYFIYNNTEYVLVKSLAKLWNYPSSYQVIAKIIRKTGVPKSDFLHKSDEDLNGSLLIEDLISSQEANSHLFYISLRFLYSVIENTSTLVGTDEVVENTAVRQRPVIPPTDDDTITVSQVFPQYGHEDNTISKDHGTFLTLTPLTKLQVYKHEGNYRRVYGTSLSAYERELIVRENNYAAFHPHAAHQIDAAEQLAASKKPLGRSRRHISSVDPNTLDVSESVLPGNGAIPEFSVGPLCKVPNYFVGNGSMNSQQTAQINAPRRHLGDLQLKFSDHNKGPKQLQQSFMNNDQEALNSKYYYYKIYRGPGSGNYKDAALVNRINKIRMFNKESAPSSNAITHLPPQKVSKPLKKRYNRPVKGLIHDFYSPDNIDVVVNRQREFTEDFNNLEMLHSTVLFNVLANSYREVSTSTWKNFYDFRMIDFEKLYSIDMNEKRRKRKEELFSEYEASRAEAESNGLPPPQPTRELTELMKPDLTERFTLPTDHAEIMKKLPLELRGSEDDPVSQISKPIRYVATYPDKQLPEVLNQIEVVKLPNANSLAWDNIKKYREA